MLFRPPCTHVASSPQLVRMERRGQTACLRGSQRLEGLPNKLQEKEAYLSEESVWSQKQNDPIRGITAYASHTCVS